MRIPVIGLALVLALSAIAAGGENPDTKMAIHVEIHSAKRTCGDLPAIAGCADIATTLEAGVYSFDAMPVFFDLTGITGAEYSLTWPDWYYSCAFTNCSDLVIGDIAWPGDGISHTWNTCQMGYSVITGWGWFYADHAGLICPIPHTGTGFIGVTDCDFISDIPIFVYCAGVYGVMGDDPCAATAADAATWGGIKSMLE